MATLDKNVGLGNYLFYNDEDEFDEITEEDNEQGFKQIYYALTSNFRGKFEGNSTVTLDEDHIDEIWVQKVDLGLYSLNDELDDRVIKCAEEYESIFEDKSLESISQLMLC